MAINAVQPLHQAAVLQSFQAQTNAKVRATSLPEKKEEGRSATTDEDELFDALHQASVGRISRSDMLMQQLNVVARRAHEMPPRQFSSYLSSAKSNGEQHTLQPHPEMMRTRKSQAESRLEYHAGNPPYRELRGRNIGMQNTV